MDHFSTPELGLALAFAGQLVVVAFTMGKVFERVDNLKGDVAKLDDAPERIADLEARAKALEEDRVVAKDLSTLIGGLVAQVGAVKDSLDKSDLQNERRFTALEGKIDQIGRKAA